MSQEAKQARLNTLRHRLDRTKAHLDTLRAIESRFPWYRLAVLAITFLVIYLAFQFLPLLPSWAVTLISLSGFIFVAQCHQNVIDQVSRLVVFQRLIETHIARATLNWENIPAHTVIAVPQAHPFAADLNITGEKSLHQLIDTTATVGGSRRLAEWLLNQEPDTEKVADRQRLVKELLGHPAFRLRLEIEGGLANSSSSSRWDTSPVLRWLDSHISTETLLPKLVLLGILAAANAVLFGIHAAGLAPPLWIATAVVYLGLQSFNFRQSSEVFEEAYSIAKQLSQLRKILIDLEKYPYPPGERLAEIAAPITGARQRPSDALRRLSRIVSAASLRNNPLLTLLLNILVPWDLFFAYQLERYKHDLRAVLPAWLDTWHEIEALSALANFAALNPGTIFPQVLAPGHIPVYSAIMIGHPLIPETARVNNDFSVQSLGEMVIITGSNMSGKSTFLRTVGVNLVLAFAGSTVFAENLVTLPFRLFTSMNLSDSLSDGISYFYAEVRRLRMLLEQLEQPASLPLFFLIDEIFRGTNNRERQLGSTAYTRALSGRNGIGLISTHDLELAHLAEHNPLVRNAHFREEIRGDQMVFDYTLRPGSSPTTNALKIMALAGLPVPESDDSSHDRMEKKPA